MGLFLLLGRHSKKVVCPDMATDMKLRVILSKLFNIKDDVYNIYCLMMRFFLTKSTNSVFWIRRSFWIDDSYFDMGQVPSIVVIIGMAFLVDPPKEAVDE